jgi:eukaryotic-like serine/threonine-protein kinase
MSSPPTTLGQYQIIREIARSNDIVYEAYDPLMNRRVAVKELAVPAGSTPQQRDERISRFKREAQAAGTLNHPHIMTVFSFSEDAGRTFMAMEYLDGSTLRNEIDTKGFIPPDRAIEIAMQVLDGLSHAHSKGVIHRDIKPDNIQMLSTGQIKITDFGIARLTFQPNLTMDGQVFGTPSYMSPEQVVGKEIDARSDLFSVGVVLYEMINGQKPFAGDSVVSITYGIMNTEPAKPQQCPQYLWEIIRKALDKSPMMRFGSAKEFSDALAEAQRRDTLNTGTQGSVFNAPDPYQTNVYQPQVYQPPQIQAPSYVYNPYSNSATPVPGVPPVQVQQNPYVQNPYQQQPAYGSPYQTNPYLPPNTMQPPTYPPVYYPPPPRQPLLKPETTDFIKKLVIALVVMGTLLALVIVAINAMASALSSQQAIKQDAGILENLDLDPRMPLDERVAKLQERRAGAMSEPAREKLDKMLAVLIAEQGQRAEQQNQIAEAELLYQKAIQKDGRNAVIFSKLAKLYENGSQLATDSEAHLNLLLKSAENWQKAYTYESDPEQKRAYGEGASAGYLGFASRLFEINPDENRGPIRRALYEARSTAPPGSDIYSRVNTLLDQVR